jgi:hypothetical protein
MREPGDCQRILRLAYGRRTALASHVKHKLDVVANVQRREQVKGLEENAGTGNSERSSSNPGILEGGPHPSDGFIGERRGPFLRTSAEDLLFAAKIETFRVSVAVLTSRTPTDTR